MFQKLVLLPPLDKQEMKENAPHRASQYNYVQTIRRWKKNQFPKYNVFNKLREMDRIQNNSFTQLSNRYKLNWQTRPSHHPQIGRKD
jgi:hypothetical protein